MAWTTPMTYTDGTALTAAQLNTYLRDNLNETMTAKATAEGSMFFSTAANTWAERIPEVKRLNGTVTTTSTTYEDLGGPTVTLETGTSALVMMACHIGNTGANRATYVSYNVSGATTIGSAAASGLRLDGYAASTGDNYIGASMFNIEEGTLNAGENTFKMTYRVDADTGSFAYRILGVLPL